MILWSALLKNRNQESKSWYEDTIWDSWRTVTPAGFMGKGWEEHGLDAGKPYEFRVRTWGRNSTRDGKSHWSVQQMTYTSYPAVQERFHVFLQGMSSHNPDYAIIKIDTTTLFHRRDRKGLTLAVFSRLNFQLVWLDTYNTFDSQVSHLP